MMEENIPGKYYILARSNDLLIAAKSGDLKAVEKSLENGANVNCKDEYGYTPLHYASERGFVDVASLLISKGADIHSRDNLGYTPLHDASRGGFVDVASLLISKGADINSRDGGKNTPLHYASKGGFVDVVSLLISKGADIHSRGYGENTPLHDASARGFVDVASLLISKGADIHSRDNLENTPLHDASRGGFVDVASLLISKGADIQSRGYGKNTPLHDASARGFVDVASLLISKGADINSQDYGKNTPLHKASEKGFVDVAELLISKGADIHSRDNLKNTPLHYASKKGFVDVASLLISKGADIHSQGYGGYTPLHYASEGGFVDVASLLISKGADIDSRDNLKNTPLHRASGGGFVDVASLLISKGADIDSRDNLGRTALKVAKGKAEILLQLVESGVNVSHALEAAKHCDSLTEAQEFIQSPPLAAATVPINMPPDGGVQQPDQDIMLPGIVDAEEFKSLLKLGTYESFGNRIYLAGACSVGKSTLACLLIGDKIPLEWKSTDGLKIFFGRNGIHLEERKMVPLDKDKGNQNILSNVLRGQPGMDKRQHDMETVKPEGFSMAKSAHNGNYQQQAKSVSISMESTQRELPTPQSNNPEKQQIVKEQIKQQEGKSMHMLHVLGFPSIHEDIKKELKRGVYRIRIAPSDLVDFGGQRSYDMTHQIFIQGKGTFTLLFDGRKGLHDPLPEYPQGIVTTQSILKHWVDSILTYCGEDDDDILPVILFVATHRDTLKEDEHLKRKEEFQQGLKQMFQDHQRKNRIWCDNIFFVNLRDQNDSEVNRLQAKYVDIAFKQKSWGQRMPMAWVPLELQMSEMRSNNISIVSKDYLKIVNEKNDDFALTESQLDEFLRVQHSMGKILYFERQGLENYIIVQPTTLVNILRSFITDEMFYPKDETLQGIHKAMTETGKIRKEDLFKLWSQEEFKQHMPDEKEKMFVAQTLIYLDFLVEPKCDHLTESVSDFYLVPCMVTRQLTVFEQSLQKEKAICLSYLLKSTVPSALSFKLICAALNVWPLKETDKGGCLYHKAAILCIDKSNELHILVKKDRVIVYLQNAQYKHNISPDIASCAQECLTHTLRAALEFYHNSFGKRVTKSEIEDLFELRVGENCDSETCFISLSEAQKTPSWICRFGKEHKTKYPLYWTYDKKEKECQEGCTGLDTDCLKSRPTDKHLVRLAKLIDIKTFADFIIHLGLKKRTWNNIEHQGGGVINMQFDAFSELDRCVKRPSFEDLNNALTKCEYDRHILCEVFREDTTVLEMDNPKLQNIPDEGTLKALSKTIGNCAFSLGVELDVDTVEIESTMYEFKKDMFGQNFDILRKWQTMSGGGKTIRTLMYALWIVDRRGFDFMKKTYKIV